MDHWAVVTALRSLVLQPKFTRARPGAHPFVPVGAPCALLVSAAPRGPVQGGIRFGRAHPNQTPEQAPDLGQRERQQGGGEVHAKPTPRQPRGARQQGRPAPASRVSRAGAAHPGAHLVATAADLALGLLEQALDAPARACNLHQSANAVPSGAWVRRDVNSVGLATERRTSSAHRKPGAAPLQGRRSRAGAALSHPRPR